MLALLGGLGLVGRGQDTRTRFVGPEASGTLQMRLTNGQCTYVEASAGGTCQLTPQGGFATDSVTGVPVAFTLARMSAADAQTTKAGLGDRDDFDAPDRGCSGVRRGSHAMHRGARRPRLRVVQTDLVSRPEEWEAERMRLGIVSDIHCNAEALALALARMGDVDELLCAGDAVFEYRFSNEVIELLRDRGARYVLGNHEHVMLDHRGARAREVAHVRPENVRYMAERPDTIKVEIDGKTLLMTHASPIPPHTQYCYPWSPELDQFAEVDADFIIIGHTHAQMARRIGRALVVNPGSAGDARDHRNGRRLSYAVLDTSTDEVLIDNFSLGDPTIAEFCTPIH